MASTIEIVVYSIGVLIGLVVFVGFIWGILYIIYYFTKKRLEGRYKEENDIGRKSQRDWADSGGNLGITSEDLPRDDTVEGRELLSSSPTRENGFDDRTNEENIKESSNVKRLDLFSFT